MKVTGWSPSSALLVTVVLAPKDGPEGERWWGASAWQANSTDKRIYKQDGQG